jgi:Complex I intermediate-associated protein 30 (CIA30)
MPTRWRVCVFSLTATRKPAISILSLLTCMCPCFVILWCSGFCGTRTLPFEKPIQVGQQAEGIYLEYRFTSDEEPERRVWKVTTRSESSRGEQLYQAMFQIQAATTDKGEWNRAEIPFSTFQQVRGPRLVEGGPALNVSNGLYQIGLSLSKFVISKNVSEIQNFRPGFFELQIKEIGIYSGTKDGNIAVPATLSKNEIAKKKPLLLKLLLPISTLVFNEKRYV